MDMGMVEVNLRSLSKDKTKEFGTEPNWQSDLFKGFNSLSRNWVQNVRYSRRVFLRALAIQ